LVIFGIGTAFLYTFLIERYRKEKKNRGQEDKEEDVSSHWMNINKREDIGN